MRCKVPIEAQHFFDVIDTEEKAYWLGFIVADGHIEKTGCGVSIELSKTDEEHLKKIASIFSRELMYRNRKLKNRDTIYHQCSIYIGGRLVNQSLRKLGLTNRKSEELNGEILNYIPDCLFHHFVRGFFDGDGTIVKGRMFLYGNINFLTALKQELENRTQLRFDITKNRSIFALYICSAHSVYIFKNYMYNDSTVFLHRKLEKFESDEPVFTTKYRFIHRRKKDGWWVVVKKKFDKAIINKAFSTENESVNFALSHGLDIDRNSTS